LIKEWYIYRALARNLVFNIKSICKLLKKIMTKLVCNWYIILINAEVVLFLILLYGELSVEICYGCWEKSKIYFWEFLCIAPKSL